MKLIHCKERLILSGFDCLKINIMQKESMSENCAGGSECGGVEIFHINIVLFIVYTHSPIQKKNRSV